MISFQKFGICVNELHQQMVHFLEVQRSIALWIFELAFVLRQEWAGRIEIVLLCLVVKRQWVELAAQGFVIAQLASVCTQVCAFVFDAQVLMNRSFCLRERDF